jgi:hypothetical protein
MDLVPAIELLWKDHESKPLDLVHSYVSRDCGQDQHKHLEATKASRKFECLFHGESGYDILVIHLLSLLKSYSRCTVKVVLNQTAHHAALLILLPPSHIR